jgi:hypothetical protein
MRTKRLLLAAATMTMLTGVANASDLPDYSKNTETYSCDKDDIKSELSDLVEGSTAGHFGLRLIYIKDSTEVSRKPDELRCRVTFVTNRSTPQKGIFRFVNKDGHALVGWLPNLKK